MADDEEEEDDDDDQDLVAYLMENDLEIGQCVRDNIIPWAVRWYTGEAAPEEEDDDDDEEEEDYDDEDEDEDESDEPPKGKAGRGRSGAPPLKKEKEKGGASRDFLDPPEPAGASGSLPELLGNRNEPFQRKQPNPNGSPEHKPGEAPQEEFKQQ
eukprot:CAMPEP_0177234694 /NCGR_PEP_ID=MMETSP0367-20130122/44527_1 /TAXON_ID=447022 ORGANISM="Scrippsiella hangoei-like, Strain SHHI-4" /NCGR_SAMPLE_ID=MMETSP0367 /ASSEMBLY_ACC=CAM_ASM_000362 /LENGTH=154 /DNA_ID=CAMNT_0018685493 /DNA_START=1 /DNA_END=466 /DNA_ORIENTATION=-